MYSKEINSHFLRISSMKSVAYFFNDTSMHFKKGTFFKANCFVNLLILCELVR